MSHAFHEFNENVQEINLNFVYSWLHISVPIIALPDACFLGSKGKIILTFVCGFSSSFTKNPHKNLFRFYTLFIGTENFNNFPWIIKEWEITSTLILNCSFDDQIWHCIIKIINTCWSKILAFIAVSKNWQRNYR